mmetsp:Transcript_20277/g.51869  ORF Transcript_20277/g.51869 Transcript_20277/m.51869 type:complete len:283 (-) Transcript_20277:1495-2343(-)
MTYRHHTAIFFLLTLSHFLIPIPNLKHFFAIPPTFLSIIPFMHTQMCTYTNRKLKRDYQLGKSKLDEALKTREERWKRMNIEEYEAFCLAENVNDLSYARAKRKIEEYKKHLESAYSGEKPRDLKRRYEEIEESMTRMESSKSDKRKKMCSDMLKLASSKFEECLAKVGLQGHLECNTEETELYMRVKHAEDLNELSEGDTTLMTVCFIAAISSALQLPFRMMALPSMRMDSDRQREEVNLLGNMVASLDSQTIIFTPSDDHLKEIEEKHSQGVAVTYVAPP